MKAIFPVCRMLFAYWLVVLLFYLPESSAAQELPLGYISYFQSKGNSTTLINSCYVSGSPWKLSKSKTYTQIPGVTIDTSNNQFPGSFGVLQNTVLGEYILEFEFIANGSLFTDSTGFFFLGPVKSCEDYYAFCFARDSLIFYSVMDGEASRLESSALVVNTRQWTKVRIERDLLKRSIHFKLQGDVSQHITFTDWRLAMGFVGFGSQNVNSGLRNLRLWAPTAIKEQEFVCE